MACLLPCVLCEYNTPPKVNTHAGFHTLCLISVTLVHTALIPLELLLGVLSRLRRRGLLLTHLTVIALLSSV